MKQNPIYLTLFLIFPLLIFSQSDKKGKNQQCYYEVISYKVFWYYDRNTEDRNAGGLTLKLENTEVVSLVAKTPELLNIWLKILDQDPRKGKVYYFKRSDTEGVLQGNVLSPPSPDCKK